jgi:hypothetical protein
MLKILSAGFKVFIISFISALFLSYPVCYFFKLELSIDLLYALSMFFVSLDFFIKSTLFEIIKD